MFEKLARMTSGGLLNFKSPFPITIGAALFVTYRADKFLKEPISLVALDRVFPEIESVFNVLADDMASHRMK